MIKTITFMIDGDGGSYEMERWQKKTPNIKIIDTKYVTETYVQNKLLITYEEKEKEPTL